MKLKVKDKNRLSVINAFKQMFPFVCYHYVLISLYLTVSFMYPINTDLFFPFIFSLCFKEDDLY